MINYSNYQVQEAILKTLAYFDILSYPLTKIELKKFLWLPNIISEDEVSFNLQVLLTENKIDKQNCFYFLKGKNENVKLRQLKVKLVEEKMKIANRAVQKLKHVPFLRAVFVCNTVASGVPNNDSDIDVLIIAKKNYMWVVRFFSTIILKFFRLRTSELNHKDRMCLSFYATDSNLNLEKLQMSNYSDIYLVYWILQLIPIYDPDNLYQSIFRANKWLDSYINILKQNYDLVEYLQVRDVDSSLRVKNILENFFAEKKYLLNFIEKLQHSKIRKNYGLYADMVDTRVVISEEFLKFHENDRRREYHDKWVNKCQEII
ncbi:MAG: hypothetical protein A2493_01215 [Candidatus Magasanikbacteria bacterium RIFOXYC12_FULL_33_11]|uniref:Polymerase nucleotidyl transferase domain-containing protein n=1 Tax=Candidatus Magasanikbacteria bacterium RIFOXYC12_FULL_33_11 TaxID=1798701 RepID=A0A1F6NN85_9BACT|nr:MAG: hypothetical protein A2493_01215 [Candidatus Magasanikbacteria bacterium RIFOXYC12_FULL_33_11]